MLDGGVPANPVMDVPAAAAAGIFYGIFRTDGRVRPH
jgi:hypothetical protein